MKHSLPSPVLLTAAAVVVVAVVATAAVVVVVVAVAAVVVVVAVAAVVAMAVDVMAAVAMVVVVTAVVQMTSGVATSPCFVKNQNNVEARPPRCCFCGGMSSTLLFFDV
jgi:hypothetical protein